MEEPGPDRGVRVPPGHGIRSSASHGEGLPSCSSLPVPVYSSGVMSHPLAIHELSLVVPQGAWY